jgi:hypothetical protein
MPFLTTRSNAMRSSGKFRKAYANGLHGQSLATAWLPP